MRFEIEFSQACPKCERTESLREYKYYLMVEQSMRGYMNALTSFCNPANILTTSISATKTGFSFLFGEQRKDVPQLICTECMSFFAPCPYCKTINKTPEKISFEHTPHKCEVCYQVFDIFIYN